MRDGRGRHDGGLGEYDDFDRDPPECAVRGLETVPWREEPSTAPSIREPPGEHSRHVVALVEDHALLSAALSATLAAEGFEVLVPAAATLGEMREELCGAGPDVALLDLDLGPLGNGAKLVRPLTSSGSRVIIVSATSNEWAIGCCFEAGAVGWVPKTVGVEELIAAVRKALDGVPLVPPQTRARLLEAWRRRRTERVVALAPFQQLSHREQEVLAMLIDGFGAERVAATSYVSVTTVRSQIHSILGKLGVNSQLEAVAMARHAGWQPPGDRPRGHPSLS